MVCTPTFNYIKPCFYMVRVAVSMPYAGHMNPIHVSFCWQLLCLNSCENVVGSLPILLVVDGYL